MSVQLSDPFSQFRKNFNITTNANQNVSKVQNTSQKTKLKPEKYLTGGLVALSILALGALAVAKNETYIESKAVESYTNLVEKETKGVIDCAKQVFNEIVDLCRKDSASIPACTISKSTMQDDKMIRNIFYTGKEAIMEEFSDSGKLIRRTIFTKDNITVKMNKNGLGDAFKNSDELFSFTNGKLVFYQNGCKKLPSGNEIAKKVITFNDDIPLLHAIGVESSKDKIKKYKAGVLFQDSKPSTYIEKYENTESDKLAFSKCFTFVNGVWKKLIS